MKSQERRDQETVTIATGLLLFALVIAVGALALVLVHQFVPLTGDLRTALGYVILGCASATSIQYVYRQRPR